MVGVHQINDSFLKSSSASDVNCKYVLYIEVKIAIEQMCLNHIHDKVVDIEAQSGNLLDTKVIFELGKRQTDKLKLNNTISKFKKFSMANRKENGNLVFGVAFKMIDAHATSATCNACIVHEGRSEEISIPGKPSKPKVKLAQENGTSVSVSWEMPENSSMVTEFVVNYSTENNFQHITTIGLTTIVNNLQPNTSYIFKVYALCSKFGVQSEESEVSDAIRTGSINTSCSSYSTDQMQPSGTLTKIDKESIVMDDNSSNLKPGKPKAVHVASSNEQHSVELSWEKPHTRESIQCYEIFYQTKNKNWRVGAHTDNGSKNSVSIKLNASQETTYKFKVVAVYFDDQEVESEESDSIIVQSLVPSSPGKPEKVCSTDTTIVIKWKEPSDNVSLVTKYNVKYCKVGCTDFSQVSTKNSIAAIERLSPGICYIFEVAAYSDYGTSVFSDVSDEILTEETPSTTRPKKPHAYKVTHNTVTLKWEQPRKYAECVKKYKIKYHKVTNTTISTTVTTSDAKTVAIIDKLTPSTGYYFMVIALYEHGASPPSPSSDVIKTLSSVNVPGIPRAGHITYNSVTLTWQKPANQAKHYEVKVIKIQSKEIVKQLTSKNENITVVDLEPETQYVFKVIAHYSARYIQESDESEPITTDRAICGAPSEPKIENLTWHSATLSWHAPTKYSKLVKKYKVSYRSQYGSQTKYTESTNIRIDNLASDTTYAIMLAAVCQAGESKLKAIDITIPATPANVCFAPIKPNVKDVMDNSLTLQWKKPQKNFNLVEYYNKAFLQNASIATYKHDKTQLPLNSMQSGQTSNESDLLSVTTKQEVPNKPGRPEKLKATYNSITIKWTKPSNNAKLVKHYVISYSIKASTSSNYAHTCNVIINPMECEQTQTDYVCTIPNLSPDTEYTIKLEACCAKNIGVESETNCIKTEKAICSTPAKPTLALLNETEYRVIVNWKAPSQYAELAQSDFVKYQTEEGKWESIKSVQPFSTVIGELKSDTSYVFGIVAECESGYSDMSETSSIRTKPYAPGKPQEVKCTHNSIVLKWTAPCENESLIEHYIVIVYEEKKEIKQVETPNTKPSITICDLLPNTTYTFKVIVVCNSKMSEESEESNPITTQPDIGMPRELISKEKIQEQLAIQQPLRKQNENLQENESKYT